MAIENSVSVEAGSTTVVGYLTAFIAAEGDTFLLNGNAVEVAAQVSSSELTLKKPWPGSTLTDQENWSLIRTAPYWSSNVAMNIRLAEIVLKLDMDIDAKVVAVEEAASSIAGDQATVAADKAAVAADKATVSADKGIVAADKATVATDKGVVAADRAAAISARDVAVAAAGGASDSEAAAAASAAAAATFNPAVYPTKANNLSDLPSAATARSNLGLGNVSNTADADKPISTAQALSIAQRLLKTGDTMTGQLAISGFTTSGGLDFGTPLVFTNNGFGASNHYFRAYHQPSVQAGMELIANTASFKFTSAGAFYATAGFKPGGGAWSDSSDERIKHNIVPYASGLAEVLALEPVVYSFDPETGRDPDARYTGLIAQATELVMPEMVSAGLVQMGDIILDDMRTLDTTPLIYALVNAIKELASRVAALETP